MTYSSNESAITVLIVDDEPVNRMVLRGILNREGISTLEASGGEEARRLAEVVRPELVLLDICMPGEDGFSTCEKLHAHPATSDIPIIFISALDDVASKVRGLTLGAWDYITKPFQREEVSVRVRNCLKLRFAFRRIIKDQAARLRQIQEAQQAILVSPADFPEARFAVQYTPVLEAGGDFYDVLGLGPGVHGYFVADISGHDLGASFATAALKVMLRQNASLLYAPDETLRIMNSVLRTLFSDGQHLTAVYVILDRTKRTLRLASAAHPSVIVQHPGGKPVSMKASGDVLGVFDSVVFGCDQVDIPRGSRFYLYSDGLLEKFGKEIRQREKGGELLCRAITDTAALPVEEAVMVIFREMAGMEQPEDDVLLMGVDV